MNLRLGDPVTVINAKSAHKGEQGIVTMLGSAAKKLVGVDFGPSNGWQLGLHECIYMKEKELRKDNDLAPENRVKRVFRSDSWHRLYTLKTPFSLENDCMHEGCEKKAVLRALVNLWGSIHDFDVCEDHADWHGKYADVFPVKRS